MAFTYKPESTNATEKRLTRVRRHIPDRVAEGALFDDSELLGFLDEVEEARGANCYGLERLAAAAACDAVAGDEVLVQKVQKTPELETDGAKTSAEWRARAKALRLAVADDLKAKIEADAVPKEPVAMSAFMRRVDAYSLLGDENAHF